MIKILVLVLLIIAIIIIGPILTIWAVNTLFPALTIPYTLQTWAAVILLGAFLRTNITTKGNQ